MRYSLDSDAIINAWRDYPIQKFPNIWEWVELLGREQVGGMSEVVFQELEKGGDECYDWFKERKELFVHPNTEEVQIEVKRLVNKYNNFGIITGRNEGDPVEVEKLKSSLKERIEEMVMINRTRMDFKERFEEMIEKYNNYSINVELQFEELYNLYKDLGEEQMRHVKENMSEEELAIFDIVTQREKIELTPLERKKIKEGIHNLIEKLRQEKLVEDWKKQQRYISDVKVTIEQEFDSILPQVYDRRLFAATVNEVFDHVYQRY